MHPAERYKTENPAASSASPFVPFPSSYCLQSTRTIPRQHTSQHAFFLQNIQNTAEYCRYYCDAAKSQFNNDLSIGGRIWHARSAQGYDTFRYDSKKSFFLLSQTPSLTKSILFWYLQAYYPISFSLQNPTSPPLRLQSHVKPCLFPGRIG